MRVYCPNYLYFYVFVHGVLVLQVDSYKLYFVVFCLYPTFSLDRVTDRILGRRLFRPNAGSWPLFQDKNCCNFTFCNFSKTTEIKNVIFWQRLLVNQSKIADVLDLAISRLKSTEFLLCCNTKIVLPKSVYFGVRALVDK